MSPALGGANLRDVAPSGPKAWIVSEVRTEDVAVFAKDGCESMHGVHMVVDRLASSGEHWGLPVWAAASWQIRVCVRLAGVSRNWRPEA